MQEKNKQRMKVAGSVFAIGGSVAALLWSIRHPQHEGPITLQCPQSELCPTAPVPGDGKCEVSKGEADPASPTFDRESCGYCGDGVRQIMTTSIIGSTSRLDPATGAMVQEVTERPSETPETCPIDFHCGNGKQDRNEAYSAWTPSIASPETLTFAVVRITETSQDCARDYRPSRRFVDRDASNDSDDQLPAFQPNQIFSCPSQVASTSSADIVTSQSQMLQSIIRRVAGIQSHSQDLRNALHVTAPDTRIVVTVAILVDPSGHVNLQRVSATCGGTPCGDQTAILNASQLTLNGLYMPPPGTTCLWTHNITLIRSDTQDTGSSREPIQKPRP